MYKISRVNVPVEPRSTLVYPWLLVHRLYFIYARKANSRLRTRRRVKIRNRGKPPLEAT